jgi:hypothetical protein
VQGLSSYNGLNSFDTPFLLDFFLHFFLYSSASYLDRKIALLSGSKIICYISVGPKILFVIIDLGKLFKKFTNGIQISAIEVAGGCHIWLGSLSDMIVQAP